MTRRLTVLAALVCATGCEAEPTLLLPERTTASPAPTAGAFDPSTCGTVTGLVTWGGPLPTGPAFLYGVPDGSGNFLTESVQGPNVPRVDARSRAVSGCVVFLRGVDPARARPWDLTPVRVELAGGAIRVRQGDGPAGRVGFVRRGDTVEVGSSESVYHVLRGRGADFFALALPDPGVKRTRSFHEPGRVELSSGAGFYWASADLFVTDHPYWTVTDAGGRFTLPRVPAGRVEVVAWHPGWLPARQDRDPETGLVTRMTYSPPVERAATSDVTPASTIDVPLSLSD